MSTSVGLVLVLSTTLSLVHGNLVAVPDNRVALVGETIRFNCSTDQIYNINWQHVPYGSKSVEDIYISRTVVPPYHVRFSVDRKETTNNVTEYTLEISSVQVKDVGTYRCYDKAGQGQLSAAQLTIIESPPNCSSNIGDEGFIGINDCGLQQEAIRCSCNLRYIGNIAPEMNWVTSEGTLLQTTSQTRLISGKSISSDLTINSTVGMNGSSVVWYPTNSTQHAWISSPIKILYVNANLSVLFVERKENFTCWANSATQCSYRWYATIDSQTHVETVEGQRLTIQDPGNYRCEAKCPLGHTVCIVPSMNVEYRQAHSQPGFVSGAVVGACSFAICLLVGLLTAKIIITRKRNRTKEKINHDNCLLEQL